MSHVVKIAVKVKNLEAMFRAGEALGLVRKPGQQTFRWWGNWRYDAPMPEGWTWTNTAGGHQFPHEFDPTKRLLGTCEHAMGQSHVEYQSMSTGYEVGIYQQADGTYGVFYDPFDLTIDDILGGDGAPKLIVEYTLQAATMAAESKGYLVTRGKDSITIDNGVGGSWVVSSSGTVDAVGFTGSSCSQPTLDLIAGMGMVTSMENKQEYYEPDVTLEVEEE